MSDYPELHHKKDYNNNLSYRIAIVTSAVFYDAPNPMNHQLESNLDPSSKIRALFRHTEQGFFVSPLWRVVLRLPSLPFLPKNVIILKDNFQNK